MSQAADNLMRKIIEAARKRLERLGAEMVYDAQIRCSIPYPPPGAAGGPPAMRTGEYAGGWYYLVSGGVGVDTLELEVSNEFKEKMARLEKGTLHAAARPVLKELASDWMSRIQEAFSG